MTQYIIRQSRHYYAGTIHNGRVSYGGTLSPEYGFGDDVPLRPFPSREAARAAIEALESEVYYLGNGEYSRPTLTPVPVTRAPQWVQGRVVAGVSA